MLLDEYHDNHNNICLLLLGGAGRKVWSLALGKRVFSLFELYLEYRSFFNTGWYFFSCNSPADYDTRPSHSRTCHNQTLSKRSYLAIYIPSRRPPFPAVHTIYNSRVSTASHKSSS
jgi:hypothetical protein